MVPCEPAGSDTTVVLLNGLYLTPRACHSVGFEQAAAVRSARPGVTTEHAKVGEVFGGVTLIGGDEGRVGMCLLENKSEVSKGCSNAMNDVGLEVVEE